MHTDCYLAVLQTKGYGSPCVSLTCVKSFVDNFGARFFSIIIPICLSVDTLIHWFRSLNRIDDKITA
jgi:hypothetical protein